MSDRQERLLALEELCEISVLSRSEFDAAAQRLLDAQPTAGAGRPDTERHPAIRDRGLKRVRRALALVSTVTTVLGTEVEHSEQE